LKDTLMAGINLLIPPVCLGCHESLLDAESILCPSCQARIKLISPNGCPKCGLAMEDGVCPACSEFKYDFDRSHSVFYYESPLTDLIHNLKYREHTRGAGFLASGMAAFVNNDAHYKQSDYITAVPLHAVRKRERGYNQSELIARRIAKLTGIKYIKAVKRRRYTASQTMLHKDQRLHNLQGAFRAYPNKSLNGKQIILVDDVFTTGSTLNEISKSLHQAGAAKVLGLTACRA